MGDYLQCNVEGSVSIRCYICDEFTFSVVGLGFEFFGVDICAGRSS